MACWTQHCFATLAPIATTALPQPDQPRVPLFPCLYLQEVTIKDLDTGELITLAEFERRHGGGTSSLGAPSHGAAGEPPDALQVCGILPLLASLAISQLVAPAAAVAAFPGRDHLQSLLSTASCVYSPVASTFASSRSAQQFTRSRAGRRAPASWQPGPPRPPARPRPRQRAWCPT